MNSESLETTKVTDQERSAIGSETLSLSNSCPPLDLIRPNETNLETRKDLSSNERSSRLELEACTKVSASVPSPDAQMTSKENPEVYTDLSLINGIFTENLVGDEGSNIGVINTLPPQSDTPHPPAPVSEAAVSESPTSPVVVQPVQSQPKVGRPTVKTKPALDKGETVRAYLLAKQKVSEAGRLQSLNLAIVALAHTMVILGGTMANSSEQMTLKQLCEAKDISYQDVEDLLELYNSEAPEDEVLERISRYPEKARALVSSFILPLLGD